MRERTSADITIYGIGGQSIATVPITAASKRVVKLMESDYIQLSFTLAEAVAFPIGSYCDDEIFGRFYVTEEQMPRYNTSNGGYDYELRMDAWYWMWNLKQCMLIRNNPSDDSLARSESVWYLTWSLREQMRQYMRNLQLLGLVPDTYDFVISDTDLDSFVDIDTDNVPKATEALTVSYNGTHLVDVLKNLAETWECEYWVTGTEDAFVIHFGKCENGTLQEINLATNAQNITPQNDTSERGGKLYYYGGADNIPNTYRKSVELIASDVTDSDSDNFVNIFRAKDRSGKYAKLTMEHLGGEKWNGLSGYIRINPDVASSPTVINISTVANGTLINQLRFRAYEWSALTEDDIPYTAMLAAKPTSVTQVHLYIDYIDPTGDPTEVFTDEVNMCEIINDYTTDPNVEVQRIYLTATDKATGEQVALDVSQWRNIALQSEDKDNNVHILSIGDTTAEDANGVYVLAMLGGVCSQRLYISSPTDTIEWTSLTGIGTYYYDWTIVNGVILYNKTLIIVRHTIDSYDTEPVRSENQYLKEYDFCYYSDSLGYFTSLQKGDYTYKDFTDYLNGYSEITQYAPQGGTQYASYLIGMADNYVVQSNSETLSLITLQQTPRFALTVKAEYMDELFRSADTITSTPEVYLVMVNAHTYPTKAAAWNYILNNGIDDVGVTEPRIVFTNLPGITLRRQDFEYYNGDYRIEYTLSLPAMNVSAEWTESYVSEGFYPVLIAKVPIHYQWLSSCEVQSAFTASFREEGKQDTFLARLKEVTVDDVTDYVFEFCQWAPWRPTVNQFTNGMTFRMAEYEAEPDYTAKLWNVPYAYWVDDMDDPASLLSIGDIRLQLPVYKASEFATYGTPKGMTYENGYIVKDGMAYKDGYIIPYSMIGDDDNRSLRELTVTDDTIYPDGKLLVKTVKRVNAKDKIDVEGQSQSLTWDYKQYHLQLRRPGSSTVLDFDRDYILPNGEPLKIRFLVPEDVKEYYESGAISQAEWDAIKTQCRLAGMQFNVAYNNEIDYQADDETTSTTHTEDVWIERNDDFGAKLPSEILFPQVLDPCVLINWNVLALSSLELIAEAEYKLLDKAFAYYAALRNGNFTFAAEMMSDWLFDLVGGLQLVTSDGKDVTDSNSKNFLVKNNHSVYAIPQLGQRVRVTHAALTDRYKDTRIIGVELSLDKPYDTPKLTIGESEAYSRLKQIEKEITKLN